MRTNLLRTCAALSLVGLALAVAAPARAVTVPINFTGTQQNFDATVDLSGNLNAVGSGNVWNASAKQFQPFKLTAPFDHALSLAEGAINASSDPKTDPLGTTFDFNSKADLVSTTDLDVDFLNGQTVDFALSTLTLTTNSKVALLNVLLGQIDLSGTLSQLAFDQTGLSIVTGSGGSGTFSADGVLNATISNLALVLGGLLTIPVDDQALALPGALTGSWTTSGPPNNTKVSLDGTISIDVPIALASNLVTSITDILSLTVSTTLDLAGSLNVTFSYHLEQGGIVIPEPSSIVLLGLGFCAALVPVARKLRRRS